MSDGRRGGYRERNRRRQPAVDSYRPATDGYSAAADQFRPPGDNFQFSYRAPQQLNSGPSASLGLPPDYQLPYQPHQPPNGGDGSRRRKRGASMNNNNNNGYGRRNDNNGYGQHNSNNTFGQRNNNNTFEQRADRPRRPIKAAHTRDILTRQHRDATPEQLAGMNERHEPRFSGFDEVSHSSEESDSKQNISEDERPVKRAKTEGTSEVAPTKWSNPDPYTVLPPPDTLGGPKKDIVNIIRKAKTDASNLDMAKKAISENADFISLDVNDNDNDDDQHGRYSTAPSPLGDSFDHDMSIPRGPKGTKHRREDEQPSLIGQVVPDWIPNDFDPTPWLKSVSTKSTSGFALHDEIEEFSRFVKGNYQEDLVRDHMIDEVEQAIKEYSPRNMHVSVGCFGSFANSLHLPDADIDLVARSEEFRETGRKVFCQSKNKMYNLSRWLDECGLVKYGTMAVIWQAKVPIIKFVERRTNIRVDISFENETGFVANSTIRAWAEKYPEMPPLVATIKQFLAMRGLNEVFNGGLGGFTIVCLVVSMLQMLPKPTSNQETPRTPPIYGELFLRFLDLYGNRFDIKTTGIIMNPPGYFTKGVDRVRAKFNENRLTIIDPNRADNDISGGSREINQIINCFKMAHQELRLRVESFDKGQDVGGSLLLPILGGNYRPYVERQAEFRRLYDGLPRTVREFRVARLVREGHFPPLFLDWLV